MTAVSACPGCSGNILQRTHTGCRKRGTWPAIWTEGVAGEICDSPERRALIGGVEVTR